MVVALFFVASAAVADPKTQAPGPSILAQLSPRQQTILSSEIQGRIDKLPFREGMSFMSGQLLVGLDCSVEEAKLVRVRAAAVAADKKLDMARRLREFNSSTALETAVAEAEAAKASAEVDAEAAVLSKCALKAPFSGKVAEVGVYRHQFVRAGDPLMKIIDDSTLEVEFLAPSVWLSWIGIGHTFGIEVTETGTTHTARVTRLGASVDPVSHSIKVVGEIGERPADLMVGMTGRILISPPTAKP